MILSDTYLYRFGGIDRLYGREALLRFSRSHVAVIGLGGVGSWVVEALARSGVGQLTLIDPDDVCVSNINRQVHAQQSSVGTFKVEALKKRVLEINPECQVNLHQELLTADTISTLMNGSFDYVVDAIDGVTNKCVLIDHCKKNSIPLLVMGSVGGKRDPLEIRKNDLSRTVEDQLLMYVKKKLRQDYNFPRNKKAFGVTAIFSQERPMYHHEGCLTLEKPKELEKPLDCQTGMGSASSLSGSMGFVAAAQILQDLAQKTGV